MDVPVAWKPRGSNYNNRKNHKQSNNARKGLQKKDFARKSSGMKYQGYKRNESAKRFNTSKHLVRSQSNREALIQEELKAAQEIFDLEEESNEMKDLAECSIQFPSFQLFKNNKSTDDTPQLKSTSRLYTIESTSTITSDSCKNNVQDDMLPRAPSVVEPPCQVGCVDSGFARNLQANRMQQVASYVKQDPSPILTLKNDSNDKFIEHVLNGYNLSISEIQRMMVDKILDEEVCNMIQSILP